ncbi:MAG: RNA polymerase sigma factor [Bacteroidota bacterium]|nr:RNA polymerase sigma factor [Bacteroidota bacterium]
MDKIEYNKECLLIRPHLLRIARARYVPSTYLAEDLVQETLVRGFNYLSHFRYGSLLSWLSFIMRRLYLTQYRISQLHNSRAKFVSYDKLIAEYPAFSYDISSSFTPAISSEILKYIDEIPEPLRTVFKMSRLEYFSQAEVAMSLSIPLGTVKSRLYRADRFMIKKLKNYVFD